MDSGVAVRRSRARQGLFTKLDERWGHGEPCAAQMSFSVELHLLVMKRNPMSIRWFWLLLCCILFHFSSNSGPKCYLYGFCLAAAHWAVLAIMYREKSRRDLWYAGCITVGELNISSTILSMQKLFLFYILEIDKDTYILKMTGFHFTR